MLWVFFFALAVNGRHAGGVATFLLTGSGAKQAHGYINPTPSAPFQGPRNVKVKTQTAHYNSAGKDFVTPTGVSYRWSAISTSLFSHKD